MNGLKLIDSFIDWRAKSVNEGEPPFMSDLEVELTVPSPGAEPNAVKVTVIPHQEGSCFEPVSVSLHRRNILLSIILTMCLNRATPKCVCFCLLLFKHLSKIGRHKSSHLIDVSGRKH